NTVEILTDKIGIPLGINQGNHWQSSEIVINKNDIFVVYTDGITELKSPDGIQFGEPALIDLIKNSNGSLDDLMAEIKLALRNHQGAENNSDDLTLLMIQPRL
ncbi:MAG: PP2C family protein-serine/threonine phosphatase, partial [Gammaproteobacteria bacterium]